LVIDDNDRETKLIDALVDGRITQETFNKLIELLKKVSLLIVLYPAKVMPEIGASLFVFVVLHSQQNTSDYYYHDRYHTK
jgi:hypothetical protein